MTEGTKEFTLTDYREILALVVQRWKFISYFDSFSQENSCLWRHDVDVSPDQALCLARIEAAEGVRATYFIHLNSMFYNALDDDSLRIFTDIAQLGHHCGLHFDPSFSIGRGVPFQELGKQMAAERQLLSTMLGVEIRCFSLHNPSVVQWDCAEDELEGMVNANGKTIQERFRYCSDSNGIWRFEPLRHVVSVERPSQLHVLTHPGWWRSESLSPRDRIQEAIDLRARRTAKRYDSFLKDVGRPNVR